MAEEAVQAVREALTGCEAVPDEVRDYVIDTATGLLDDMLVLPPSVCPDSYHANLLAEQHRRTRMPRVLPRRCKTPSDHCSRERWTTPKCRCCAHGSRVCSRASVTTMLEGANQRAAEKITS